jgi:Ca2+-binding EF-hand superfamily protein
MKWLTTTLAVTVITSAFAAPAFAEHPKRDRGLDRQQAVHQVMRSFKKMDRNHDGYVTRREVRRSEKGHHNRGYEQRTSYRSDRYNKNTNYITSGTFRKYDRNKDGYIKKKEAKRAVKRRFDRADRNHDGYLNRREIQRSGWYEVSYSNDRNYRDKDSRNGDRDRNHRR